jgi:rod shape-determining protein MreC
LMRVSWNVFWQKDFPVFLLLVVVSVGLMAAGRGAGVNAVSNALGYVFLPFEVMSSKLLGLSLLYEENRELRGRLAEVSRDNMALREKVYENDRLTRLLDFKSISPVPLRASRVVAEVDQRLGGGIIVDGGHDEGLARNMAVVSPDGLVGLVVRAGQSMSTVKRIVDPGSKISVCLEPSRITGILSARSDGALYVDWVAPDADVQLGDTLVSSGLGSVIPKGILVGEVKGIQEDPGKFSLSLRVGSFVDFKKLEEVFILLGRPVAGIEPEDIGGSGATR